METNSYKCMILCMPGLVAAAKLSFTARRPVELELTCAPQSSLIRQATMINAGVQNAIN